MDDTSTERCFECGGDLSGARTRVWLEDAGPYHDTCAKNVMIRRGYMIFGPYADVAESAIPVAQTAKAGA